MVQTLGPWAQHVCQVCWAGVVRCNLESGGSNSNDGSEASPFLTIQYAIDNVPTGDTVIVKPGTYSESISIQGKGITLGSLFLTTGDTSKVSSTIIDGSNGWGIDINNSSSGTIQSTTKISGLTIKNGNAQSSSSGHGAGVRVFFYDEVLIDRCVIRDNRDYAGSGISVVENVNTVKVTNSKIISNENYGGNGAGINVGMNFYSNIGRFEIRNSIIADNTGANDGGGICSYADTTIIANCTITGNEAGWASGVCFYNAGGDSALLLNSIISQNSTGGSI